MAGSTSGNSWNAREEGSTDGSQSATIGRGPPPVSFISWELVQEGPWALNHR